MRDERKWLEPSGSSLYYLLQNIYGNISYAPAECFIFAHVADIYAITFDSAACILCYCYAVTGNINPCTQRDHAGVYCDHAFFRCCACSCDAVAACVIRCVSSYFCFDLFCVSVAVDDDPRACYFKQVLNGKYMRMALILLLLKEAGTL